MAVLHNKVSNKELKEKMMTETEPRKTFSFYRYFPIEEPLIFRDELYSYLFQLNVFGRIYIATEGINAQVSVPENRVAHFRDYLNNLPGMNNLRLNPAILDNGKSFWVLKIKVRSKIVADGITDSAFNMQQKGRYVDAKGMNEMLNDPDTIIVDMRNHYEYEVGHFIKARELPSDTFRDQLPMAVDMLKGNEDKNIVMYCTGGIRCEKASAWLLHKGFRHVFHLDGGIIQYARQVEENNMENKFIGKNFVFDNRLGERVSNEIIAHCHQCGKPCDDHVNCANDGCHLLFIQCSECAEKMNHCCSEECKEMLSMPEERRKQLRSGIDKGQHIFNKSKMRLRPRLNILNEKKG
ncbi:MAG: rhodanese-related sulfurtransferase [Bacteroidetes bacterium]|nr:rhodanese-related sulfurtransferase [Bacteroidota bacterium]